MRDWSIVKADCEKMFYTVVSYDLLEEAIAEIEQLRQDLETQNQIRSEAMGEIGRLRQEKVELVEALRKTFTAVTDLDCGLTIDYAALSEIIIGILAKHGRSDSE